MACVSKSDYDMESPRSLARRIEFEGGLDFMASQQEANVDEESIAFGVMYYPRSRVQRTDEFNCDTRLLREGVEDSEDTAD